MRKLKSHWAAGDVYLSSPARVSVGRDYHKIRGSVKKHASTAISCGRSKPTGSAKRTIYKLPHQFRRSLLHNDLLHLERFFIQRQNVQELSRMYGNAPNYDLAQSTRPITPLPYLDPHKILQSLPQKTKRRLQTRKQVEALC
jgi:hypothetical protein